MMDQEEYPMRERQIVADNIKLTDVLAAALSSGIAHNNGAGGWYLLCANEQQLLNFADNLRAQQLNWQAEYAEKQKDVLELIAENEKLRARQAPGAGEVWDDVDWQAIADDCDHIIPAVIRQAVDRHLASTTSAPEAIRSASPKFAKLKALALSLSNAARNLRGYR
jgi:hypothetical protein